MCYWQDSTKLPVVVSASSNMQLASSVQHAGLHQSGGGMGTASTCQVWWCKRIAHPNEAAEHVADPRQLRRPMQRCVEEPGQDCAGKKPFPVALAGLP